MEGFVKVVVPATTANCGPGFDVLGIACGLYNEIELKLHFDRQLIIEITGDGADELARDESNLVWQCIRKLLNKANSSYQGAHIKLHNKVPLSRGLGSSASAIVAGLVAANSYLGTIFSNDELLEMATAIEGHPDNVAPALLGGMVVSTYDDARVQYVRFIPQLDLQLVVAIPEFHLSTKKAREVLPTMVDYKDAIFNVGHASLIVAALAQGKVEALQDAFVDKLHQPYREALIPGMNTVFEAAKTKGALGVTISGAGPTLIAYTLKSKANGDSIGKAMVQAFNNHNIEAHYLVLDIDNQGAHVLV